MAGWGRERVKGRGRNRVTPGNMEVLEMQGRERVKGRGRN